MTRQRGTMCRAVCVKLGISMAEHESLSRPSVAEGVLWRLHTEKERKSRCVSVCNKIRKRKYTTTNQLPRKRVMFTDNMNLARIACPNIGTYHTGRVNGIGIAKLKSRHEDSARRPGWRWREAHEQIVIEIEDIRRKAPLAKGDTSMGYLCLNHSERPTSTLCISDHWEKWRERSHK